MTKILSRTTILIDKELWKRFKIKAIREGVYCFGTTRKTHQKGSRKLMSSLNNNLEDIGWLHSTAIM